MVCGINISLVEFIADNPTDVNRRWVDSATASFLFLKSSSYKTALDPFLWWYGWSQFPIKSRVFSGKWMLLVVGRNGSLQLFEEPVVKENGKIHDEWWMKTERRMSMIDFQIIFIWLFDSFDSIRFSIRDLNHYFYSNRSDMFWWLAAVHLGLTEVEEVLGPKGHVQSTVKLRRFVWFTVCKIERCIVAISEFHTPLMDGTCPLI